MRTTGCRRLTSLATIAVAGALAAAATPSRETRRAAAEPRHCCIANPRHAGICKVWLAEGETCSDVLEYLNNAAAVGKSYCGNTPVRIGWKQVACQKEE